MKDSITEMHQLADLLEAPAYAILALGSFLQTLPLLQPAAYAILMLAAFLRALPDGLIMPW